MTAAPHAGRRTPATTVRLAGSRTAPQTIADSPRIGASGLLRVAAFPADLWLRGSNPGLFQLLRALAEAVAAHRSSASALAERIGHELIPCEAMSGRDRGWALALRRRLHRGGRIEAGEAERLIALLDQEGDLTRCVGEEAGETRETTPRASDKRGSEQADQRREPERPTNRKRRANEAAQRADQRWVEQVREVERLGAELQGLERRAAAAVEAEERRLLGLPWDLAQSVPMVARAMRQADHALFVEIERRIAAGEPWHTKRMRRRDRYLWRLLDRGAVKATPRAWFAHVGLVRFDDDAHNPDNGTSTSAGDGGGFRLTGETVCRWVENVHSSRTTAQLDDDSTLLTVTPLHWYDGQHLVAWVTKLDTTVSVTEVRVRRIPLLEAICDTLRPGALPLSALQTRVAPANREVLKRFLAHLAGTGIIEICRPPRVTTALWNAPEPPERGFLDVYRGVSGTIPPAVVEDLETDIQQALRITDLMRQDTPTSGQWAEVTAEPRPALTIFRAMLDKATPHAPHHDVWPLPQTEGSGYSQLVNWLDQASGSPSVSANVASVDVSPALLDAFGATTAPLSWPVDVLLRILYGEADHVAALDGMTPGAILDARFAEALHELNGPVPHVVAYRRFLQHLEEETGYLFLEVLVPPMSVKAANAVRRPRYTRAWTGDADLATYCGDGEAARYVPLDTIMMHRDGERVVATVDGRPVWPVHHATRTAIPPWDLLVRLLRSAAPRPFPSAVGTDLRQPLGALPGRTFVPRITTGRLVISAAQWRVERDELWAASGPTLAKAQALDALRARLGLPRWIMLADPRQGNATCCDLESLRSIRAFDQLLEQEAPTITITEALPAPPDYPVTDPAHDPAARHAAQLMLRVPTRLTTKDVIT